MKAINYQHAELKTESLFNEDKPDINLPAQLKQLNLNEMPKPLSIDLPRKDFISLMMLLTI